MQQRGRYPPESFGEICENIWLPQRLVFDVQEPGILPSPRNKKLSHLPCDFRMSSQLETSVDRKI